MQIELKNQGIKNSKPKAEQILAKIKEREIPISFVERTNSVIDIAISIFIEHNGSFFYVEDMDIFYRKYSHLDKPKYNKPLGLSYMDEIYLIEHFTSNFEKLYVLIHELGHFFMEHRYSNKSKALKEYEADGFATHILKNLFPEKIGEILEMKKRNGKYSRTYLVT